MTLRQPVDRDGESLTTRKVQMIVGALCFTGRLEAQAAPKSVAWLAEHLPFDGIVLHARWSGEAAWMPLGLELKLAPENAMAYPHPGQLLLYAGNESEPELLIPYGACAFASRAGALAGNHVITLEGDMTSLRTLGETLLHQGAQSLQLTWQ
ncbi:DUF3830 family protein [Rhodanobacter koreensis]